MEGNTSAHCLLTDRLSSNEWQDLENNYQTDAQKNEVILKEIWLFV